MWRPWTQIKMQSNVGRDLWPAVFWFVLVLDQRSASGRTAPIGLFLFSAHPVLETDPVAIANSCKCARPWQWPGVLRCRGAGLHHVLAQDDSPADTDEEQHEQAGASLSSPGTSSLLEAACAEEPLASHNDDSDAITLPPRRDPGSPTFSSVLPDTSSLLYPAPAFRGMRKKDAASLPEAAAAGDKPAPPCGPQRTRVVARGYSCTRAPVYPSTPRALACLHPEVFRCTDPAIEL